VDVVQQEILSAFAGFASRQNIRLEGSSRKAHWAMSIASSSTPMEFD
jgi:hypothetical protein